MSMVDDDDDEWVECWQCVGEGRVESCMEDTCVCVDPPCCTSTCDICKGAGGWERPIQAALEGEG